MATANGHPATPPPSDPSSTAKPDINALPEPDIAPTAAEDDGQSKRPRDARTIHMILANQGVMNYQQRVPLQLLDFAYRYTSGILSDSLRLAAEGYSATNTAGNKRGGGSGGDDANMITVTAVRQAIASRQGYTFQAPLEKEFMLEQANERNRIALPKVERGYGVQLPPEKYCLTGVGWGIKDEWESDEEIALDNHAGNLPVSSLGQDEDMGGMDANEDEDEEGAGRMEDVFGESGDTAMEE